MNGECRTLGLAGDMGWDESDEQHRWGALSSLVLLVVSASYWLTQWLAGGLWTSLFVHRSASRSGRGRGA